MKALDWGGSPHFEKVNGGNTYHLYYYTDGSNGWWKLHNDPEAEFDDAWYDGGYIDLETNFNFSPDYVAFFNDFNEFWCFVDN